MLKKSQTSVSQDMEEKILSMYAKGMTTGDMEAHIQDIYGIEVSDTTISRCCLWRKNGSSGHWRPSTRWCFWTPSTTTSEVKAMSILPSAWIWTAGKTFWACGLAKMRVPSSGGLY